jgi:uroporphyrinogen-III decarboxylase
MLSEKLFDKFLAPFYRRVVPHIKARGAKVFIDSDGQVESAIPWFEAVGIEGILPLERQSGVDVARIRAGHPRFLMLGAFDKMVMNQGEMAMRKEFERLLLVARQGGLVIGCDHQTPPGVSLADYQLYLRLFREYAERAGSESARRV